MTTDPGHAHVYKLWGADHEALYVGFSLDLAERLKSHACSSPWWTDVQETESTLYATPRDAINAEAEAIWQLQPKYNDAGKDSPYKMPHGFGQLAWSPDDPVRQRQRWQSWSHPGSSLTAQQVLEIRAAWDRATDHGAHNWDHMIHGTRRALASRYGTTTTNVSYIGRRLTWRHLAEAPVTA